MESLLKYLSDGPAALMPKVLAFIQRQRDQIQSMSKSMQNSPSLFSLYSVEYQEKTR